MITPRWVVAPGLPSTIRPPPDACANAARARSISPLSRTSMGRSSTPSDGASAWIAPNWPGPAAMLVSRKTATRVTRGRPVALCHKARWLQWEPALLDHLVGEREQGLHQFPVACLADNTARKHRQTLTRGRRVITVLVAASREVCVKPLAWAFTAVSWITCPWEYASGEHRLP